MYSPMFCYFLNFVASDGEAMSNLKSSEAYHYLHSNSEEVGHCFFFYLKINVGLSQSFILLQSHYFAQNGLAFTSHYYFPDLPFHEDPKKLPCDNLPRGPGSLVYLQGGVMRTLIVECTYSRDM